MIIIVTIPANLSDGSDHDEYVVGRLEPAVADHLARGHRDHRIEATVTRRHRTWMTDWVDYDLDVVCSTCGHAETMTIETLEPDA